MGLTFGDTGGQGIIAIILVIVGIVCFWQGIPLVLSF
jgi:hypothetical protein